MQITEGIKREKTMSINLVLPSLYCPFPSALHPAVERIHENAFQWMQYYGYLDSERAIRRFHAGKFAWVTSRAHPHAAEDRVLLVATWMSWLFLLDDLCDEADLGKDPRRLRALHERVLNVLHDTPTADAPDDLIRGLRDVWSAIRDHSSAAWVDRFVASFEEYADGCLWEADNRACDNIPSLKEYIRNRRKTSALYIFFDLIEFADEVTLPVGVLEHEAIRELRAMANDGVAWFNDIVSLEKELKNGDIHNLVIVLQNEEGLSLQSAVDRAADIFNARVHEYAAAETRRPRFEPDVERQLERYLDGLRYWVRGNVDWSFETGRYGQKQKDRTGEAT